MAERTEGPKPWVNVGSAPAGVVIRVKATSLAGAVE